MQKLQPSTSKFSRNLRVDGTRREGPTPRPCSLIPFGRALSARSIWDVCATWVTRDS